MIKMKDTLSEAPKKTNISKRSPGYGITDIER